MPDQKKTAVENAAEAAASLPTQDNQQGGTEPNQGNETAQTAHLVDQPVEPGAGAVIDPFGQLPGSVKPE